MSKGQQGFSLERNPRLSPKGFSANVHRRKSLDAVFILTLPFLFLLFLTLDEPVRHLACVLTAAIFFYELITYDYAELYGLSGLKVISFPSLAFVSFTVMIAIPSIFVVLNESSDHAYTFFYAVNSFYLFFPFGLLLANYFFRVDLDRLAILRRQNFVRPVNANRIFYILWILLGLCLLIMGAYILRIEKIPLLELIRHPGERMRLALLREESMKLLEIPWLEHYLYSWLRTTLFAVGIIASLFMAVVAKEMRFKVLFVLFLLFGLFNNSLTITKAHAAFLILSIALFYFLKKGGKISLRLFLGSAFGVFSFPYLIVKFKHEVVFDFFRILYILWLRIFYVPAWVLYKYFEVFPNYHDFLGGRTSHLYSWFHNEGSFPVANYVFQYFSPTGISSGSASANYLSFFWADFGWTGLILSSLVVGVITHYSYWILLRACCWFKDVVYVTTVTVLSMSFSFFFAGANFPIIVVSHGIILFLIAFWTIEALRKRYEISQPAGNL
ncbi:MAG: hypothetical protein V3U24_05595 [Candidatus Neomarinimicrobiota bacterium]